MADNGFGVMLTHHSSLGVIVTIWQTQVIIQPKMVDNRFGAVLTYLILNDNTDSPGYGTKDTDDNDDTDMTNIEYDGMPPQRLWCWWKMEIIFQRGIFLFLGWSIQYCNTKLGRGRTLSSMG